jgi:LysM repeat protein
MLEEIAKRFKTTVEALKTTNPITLSMEKEKLQQMLSKRIYNELGYSYY